MIIKVDTREKDSHKWSFAKYLEDGESTVVGKLDQGDYSLDGHEGLISIERKKSVSEIINNLAKEKGRFLREIERLKGSHKFSCVVCEFTLQDILSGSNFSRVSPNYIISSMIEIEYTYRIPFHLMGNMSEFFAYRFLKKVHKISKGEHRW